MVGDKNTIIKPSNEKVNDLVASLIFSSSPIEKIYLKPVITREITAIKTEKEMAKLTIKNTNPIKSPCPVLLRISKSKNIKTFN